jgi:3-oxoacyl-[acyl-carrier-protein] synthase III
VHGVISAIEYVLPSQVLTTEKLSTEFPEWTVEKIDHKTGIACRHIVSPGQCASDLAYAAASQLFLQGACQPEDVDYILLCTQSPDFVLPTTACLLQERLGVRKTSGALDFNLGCSGFVYGLGLAEGLIATSQANTILLLTAETYSIYLGRDDRSARTIFGDGAAATLVKSCDTTAGSIGPFQYGTNGAGGNHIIVENSGARHQDCGRSDRLDRGACDGPPRLHMDGPKVFDFVLRTVPQCVAALLAKAGLTLDDIDLFVFHQANALIVSELGRSLGIPPNKLQITLSHCANTVSSTIPIALKHAVHEGRLRGDDLVMIVGFGVGLSWGASLIRWDCGFQANSTSG